MSNISIIIPAYNEANRISNVLEPLTDNYDVLVVDDGSSDDTAEVASEAGAKVIKNQKNRGYIHSIKKGFQEAGGEIIVTMDADGEHRPKDIQKLTKPIQQKEKDIVFGARKKIPRPSEKILNKLTNLKINIKDSGTGFRALKKDLAKKLELDTVCTCGTLALEAHKKGARIGEVPIETQEIDKPRKIAWKHLFQFFHVIRYLIS